MDFLVDAQLPRALCARLRSLGHGAVHVSKVLSGDAPDDAIWTFAASRGWVIVSKDEDFARRARTTSTGPSVVWVRIGNRPNDALWALLELVWQDVCRLLAAGERLVEVT